MWYGQCRKDETLNEVEQLMNKPRIIPKSCLQMRDTGLITFQPCNPDSVHNHGKWSYEYSAWDTVQQPWHVGTSGSCLDLGTTKNFGKVLEFYKK